MHPQDIQQQQIIRAIKTALTFDIAYQKVRPDISSFIAITSTLSLINFKVWENTIRLHIALSLENYSLKKCRLRTLPLGSLRWLDLCSGDGFKREKALKLLSGAAPNSFLFCLVTRRLNDWVPQVRTAAREALTRLIETTDPEHTVDMLWVSLPCWNSWTRMGELERKSLLEILNKPDIAEALKKRLMTSASGLCPLFSHKSDALQSSMMLSLISRSMLFNPVYVLRPIEFILKANSSLSRESSGNGWIKHKVEDVKSRSSCLGKFNVSVR